MATAGDLIQRLNSRIREEAYTHEQLLDMVSRCQQLVNASQQLILDSDTLVTVPHMQVYDLSLLIAEQIHVLSVQEGTRDLDKLTDWKELAYHDRQWFRRLGPRFETYAMMGRDILLLHPAKDVESSVTIVYNKLTTAFITDDDVVEVPEDSFPLLLNIAEALLLLRDRRLESVPYVIQRVGRELGVDLSGKN